MLKIRNLSKEFAMHVGEEKLVPCLENVSLTVEAGRMTAVIGPSGAGKSSLLKCVYGTYLASGGQILYTCADGEEIDLASADLQTMRRLRLEEIGYVSQFFYAVPRISALEVLCEPLLVRGEDTGRARERARELLETVGLPEVLWGMYPSTFSGGEKQRLNIAYGLITRPRLMLLDEPTSSLDAASKDRVLALISDLKSRGSAVLGVFHDFAAMRRVADESYNIQSGEIEVLAG